MFDLFSMPPSPVGNWTTAHAPLAILLFVALIASATMMHLAQHRADGGLDDWFGDFD
jgi:hypothetical protein